jgi:hypothetical protein
MCKENNAFKVMCKGIADHTSCLFNECKWVPTDTRTAKEKADCTLKVFQYLINNDKPTLGIWYDQTLTQLIQCLPKDEFFMMIECLIKLAGLAGITQDEYQVVYNTVRKLQEDTNNFALWFFTYPNGPDDRLKPICALALATTSYGYCRATGGNPKALPGLGEEVSDDTVALSEAGGASGGGVTQTVTAVTRPSPAPDAGSPSPSSPDARRDSPVHDSPSQVIQRVSPTPSPRPVHNSSAAVAGMCSGISSYIYVVVVMLPILLLA